jgi:hypothetical protein
MQTSHAQQRLCKKMDAIRGRITPKKQGFSFVVVKQQPQILKCRSPLSEPLGGDFL